MPLVFAMAPTYPFAPVGVEGAPRTLGAEALGQEEKDGRLVERTLDGDMSAFRILYQKHAPAVAVVARDQVRDANGIADIVQEVFTRALERLSTLRVGERFRPWLLAIARHTAVDERRLRSKVTDLDDAQTSRRAGSEPGPEELAELRELARLVRGCVADLSRRDATAVALVAEFGFSPAELGEALGVTTGAAKVIVHRARRRLRDALALELLVRQRDAACPELWALYDSGELARAGRHLQECDMCSQLSSSDGTRERA
jgi:RNA polymerase sigma factor (sigma-70 family)